MCIVFWSLAGTELQARHTEGACGFPFRDSSVGSELGELRRCRCVQVTEYHSPENASPIVDLVRYGRRFE